MPAVVRINDTCTGHGPFPPRNNIEGSGNVFINGLAAHTVGHKWNFHCFGLSCHDGVTSTGSPTVFVNGKPLARVGDSVSCGSVIASGSGNVFAG